MITIRKSAERGHANHGWLDTYHTWSFARYDDPRQMGFRALRVLNEDRVAPGGGFPTHPHQDMEIVTVVLEGALQHGDSLGNGSQIRPGDVQRMSAGTGIAHSEGNASKEQAVHLMQIWIEPERESLAPGYEQKYFAPEAGRNKLQLLGSRDGRDDSVTIHQDVALYRALLDADASVTHDLQPDRHAWLQVARGEVSLNGQTLSAGDGAAVSDESRLEIGAQAESELLLFDLA